MRTHAHAGRAIAVIAVVVAAAISGSTASGASPNHLKAKLTRAALPLSHFGLDWNGWVDFSPRRPRRDHCAVGASLDRHYNHPNFVSENEADEWIFVVKPHAAPIKTLLCEGPTDKLDLQVSSAIGTPAIASLDSEDNQVFGFTVARYVVILYLHDWGNDLQWGLPDARAALTRARDILPLK